MCPAGGLGLLRRVNRINRWGQSLNLPYYKRVGSPVAALPIWLVRIDEDLTVRNSGLRPAHYIHWRLATLDWIAAHCQKARINLVGLLITMRTQSILSMGREYSFKIVNSQLGFSHVPLLGSPFYLEATLCVIDPLATATLDVIRPSKSKKKMCRQIFLLKILRRGIGLRCHKNM